MHVLTLIRHIKQTQGWRRFMEKITKTQSMQWDEFFHRFPTEHTPILIYTNENRRFHQVWVSCMYFQTCTCWSLTFKIIVNDPKQLPVLRLIWGRELQKPFRNEGIFVWNSSFNIRSITVYWTYYYLNLQYYIHTVVAGIHYIKRS